MAPSEGNRRKTPLLPMSAGCIAGGIEATAVWPMEFIKTQLQLHSKTATGSGLKPLPYTGMISGLTYTVRTTGFLSLYRGLAPTLLGSIPKAGIRFGLNSVIKDQLRDPETGKLTLAQNFVAGLGAGVCEAIIIVAPVETVKTKCIELNAPFISGMQHILKTDGIGGIYQGAAATAMKQGSNQGLRFMWFNEYKRIVTRDGEEMGNMTPLMGLFGGMSAGCFSTLGNNPFDVVKTRMQGTQASRYKNTIDCFRQIASQEGISAFYADQLRDPETGKLTIAQNFVAGLGAGVCEAIIIVAPVETIKTKCIELNAPFISGMQHILKTDGIGGIYEGAAATAMKQGSNQGLRFMWFNEYKRIVTRDGEEMGNMTPLMGLFGGMSAGCFSTLGNNPFDVVKTRMQGTQASRYKNTMDCFRQIASQEGILAFYAGIVPRLGRVVPGQGIIFMSFETIQSALEKNISFFRQ